MPFAIFHLLKFYKHFILFPVPAAVCAGNKSTSRWFSEETLSPFSHLPWWNSPFREWSAGAIFRPPSFRSLSCGAAAWLEAPWFLYNSYEIFLCFIFPHLVKSESWKYFKSVNNPGEINLTFWWGKRNTIYLPSCFEEIFFFSWNSFVGDKMCPIYL